MGDVVVRLALLEETLGLATVHQSSFHRQAIQATSRKELLTVLSRIKSLTSCTSFSLRRSRAGKRIISVFSLCSAASPDTGLASTVGLSFAETHGATPGSGRSRPTFAKIPAINWLCKCSTFGSVVT